MSRLRCLSVLTLMVCSLVFSGQKAFAETSEYPLVHVTPDKLEILRVEKDVVSVMVGNPAHLSVLLDTPRTLVLVPKEPGTTYFQALDANGEPVLERHVVVVGPQKDYVRVRRACALGDDSCEAYSVFFCPDTCHEIHVSQEQKAGTSEDPEPSSVQENENAAEEQEDLP